MTSKRDSLFMILFLMPFLLSFLLFIFIPVGLAMLLSFTSFNAFSFPEFVGLDNYIALFTQDEVFLRYALPNTLKFAFFVGPVGYALSFIFAWFVHRIPKRVRDYYTLAIYAPSLAGGVVLSTVWIAFFSGDRVGYLNFFLLRMGWIDQAKLWLQDPKYLLNVMIIVTLWTSFSIGFLVIVAGLQTINPELLEAGKIDGIKNSLQEIYYITIPSMKPQMLFSAIMAIVGTLKAGQISVQLTGQLITPKYAGHLIINHIDDYALLRYELGYASSVSVVLLLIAFGVMKICYRVLEPKDNDE